MEASCPAAAYLVEHTGIGEKTSFPSIVSLQHPLLKLLNVITTGRGEILKASSLLSESEIKGRLGVNELIRGTGSNVWE